MKVIINFKNMLPRGNYIKMWEAAKYYPLFLDLGMVFPLSHGLMNIFGVSQKKIALLVEESFLQTYHEVVELKNAGRIGHRSFLDTPWFTKFVDSITLLHQKAELYFSTLPKIKNAEKQFLIHTFLNGMNIQEQLFSYFAATQPEYISEIEQSIEQELQHFSPRIKQKINAIMLQYEVASTIVIERMQWLERLLAAKSFDEAQTSEWITSHWEKYRFHNAIEGNQPLTLSYYHTLWTSDQEKIDEYSYEYKHLLASYRDIAERKIRAKNQYHLKDSLIHMFSVCSRIGHERFELRLLWMKMDYILKQQLIRLADLLQIPVDHLFHYRKTELHALFQNGSTIRLDEITRRKNHYAIIFRDTDVTFVSHKNIWKRIKSQLQEPIDQNTSVIKGTPACGGIYKGKVVKIDWRNTSNINMPEGSVLVAGQTRPQLMPYIRLAGAIITDEGGITSHAAIISRELNKPCVVGTKIATKILMTGDEVMVDADNGVIYIK